MTDDRVTVITATMPGREWELCQAAASVWQGTVVPYAHLIRGKAPGRWGPGPIHLAEQRNELLKAATTPWVATLDDDDRFLPNHLEELGKAFDDADVVYSWDATHHIPVEQRVNVNGWPWSEIAARLAKRNFIPSNAMFRRDLALSVGGYPEHYSIHSGTFKGTPCTWEDWALWFRLAEVDARFVCVPVETWEYHFNPKISTQSIWNRRRAEMGVTA